MGRKRIEYQVQQWQEAPDSGGGTWKAVGDQMVGGAQAVQAAVLATGIIGRFQTVIVVDTFSTQASVAIVDGRPKRARKSRARAATAPEEAV